MSELRPLIRLAGPVVLAEIGWMSMGLVDTVMVGSLGPAAIGATGFDSTASAWAVTDRRALGGLDGSNVTARADALDVNDLVALANAKVDGFLQLVLQALHVGQRFLADVEARLDEIAELEQPDAQAIRAGFDAIDQPVFDHDREDAMRGRRMQVGLTRELLEIGGTRMGRQRLDQAHHAIDDLNGRLGLSSGHGSVSAVSENV